MKKAELRELYLTKRLSLSEAEYNQINFQLYQHFFAGIDLSFIHVLHTFLPIPNKKEPDTWLIIDRIRREFPHIRISIPKINPLSSAFDSIYFEGLHQLETNAWGIQEPKQGVPTEPEKIDMVLVPLLVFDQQGQRVGFGKGFYDRFLVTCKPSCKKIGLSLFEEVDLIEDTDGYDVPLDQCVTPSGVINFTDK